MNESLLTSKVGPPLLESFSLEGLNGYKNISILFERNVKIVSAENGSGKTTILNALHALLIGKPQKLFSIDFAKVSIKFRDQAEMSFSKSELLPTFPVRKDSKKVFGSAMEQHLFDISQQEWEEMLVLFSTKHEEYFNCAGYQKLVKNIPLGAKEIDAICIRELTRVQLDSQFAKLHEMIKAAMGEVSVLYLPTFRRIEADLPEYQKVHQTKNLVDDHDAWDTDRLIFFGLQDVTQRLESIASDIRRGTSEAYSRISSRTLDQLLDVGSATTEVNLSQADVAMLSAVFARLGRSASASEAKILQLIENGKINDPENQSLRTFLAQLLEVYQGTHELESAVESFVNVIDAYWKQPSSEKRFQFDKKTVEAQAIDSFTGKPLPLATLSSGEKQIVSIFARLYLDQGKRYLILIDEPELSLSMEWQQKFLPDVMRAPSCAQLIAITHSPFTFDNELDAYAGSLNITYSKKAVI